MTDFVRPMDPAGMLLAIEGRESELAFVFDVPPQSKARARTVQTRRGPRTFTPIATRTAEEHMAWAWKLHRRGRVFDGNLAVACVFYMPTRRRVDGDNMIKLVLDAGTKAGVWHDDSQVTTKLLRVELDRDYPRTEVALCRSISTLAR